MYEFIDWQACLNFCSKRLVSFSSFHSSLTFVYLRITNKSRYVFVRMRYTRQKEKNTCRWKRASGMKRTKNAMKCTHTHAHTPRQCNKMKNLFQAVLAAAATIKQKRREKAFCSKLIIERLTELTKKDSNCQQQFSLSLALSIAICLCLCVKNIVVNTVLAYFTLIYWTSAFLERNMLKQYWQLWLYIYTRIHTVCV